MSHDVVNRLLSSFAVLENAIAGARQSLSSRAEVPVKILDRIDSYSALLTKQRDIAEQLAASVDLADWNDVAHKIRLINGLLDLIRQDAREIVQSLSQDIDTEETSESLVN